MINTHASQKPLQLALNLHILIGVRDQNMSPLMYTVREPSSFKGEHWIAHLGKISCLENLRLL